MWQLECFNLSVTQECDSFMELDLPLILMIATAVTGVIALVDKLWLRKQRLDKADALQDAGADDEAVEKAAKEPYLIEQSYSFFPVLAVTLFSSVNSLTVYVCRALGRRLFPSATLLVVM